MENNTIIILLLSAMMLAILFSNCSIPNPAVRTPSKPKDE